MAMKVSLVAVFGHYDSRGGTMAIPVSIGTPNQVIEACRKYDEDCFAWSQMLQEYDNKPDEWGWNPHDENSRPSANDFMYVALLYYPDTVDITKMGDLEGHGTVIVDQSTEPDFGELPKKDMDRMSYHGDWTIDHKIRESLNRPTVLEFVPLGMGRYESMDDEDADAWKERVFAKAKVLTVGDLEIPEWNDDAFGFIVGTGI